MSTSMFVSVYSWQY